VHQDGAVPCRMDVQLDAIRAERGGEAECLE
jgi:hypothetical protein